MRQRSLIVAVAAVVLVALAGLAALYAYGSTRGDVIASGVRIAGVDVGGLDRAHAEQRLRSDLVARLAQPITVRADGRTFQLNGRAAAVAVDVPGLVDAAFARSARGGALARGWRELTGGRLAVDIAAQPSYSRPALARFVGALAQTVDRPPRDATIAFSDGRLVTVPALAGLRLDGRALQRVIAHALIAPGAARVLAAPLAASSPKITTAALASRYPTVITVQRSAFTLRLYQHLRLVKTYQIAVGMIGLETPAGRYTIQDKVVDPAWNVPNSPWAGSLAGKTIPPGPQDPIKARWMGIFNGAGIHGIDPSEYSTIGHYASHGCIRMRIPDVIDLYNRVSVGTPVFIA